MKNNFNYLIKNSFSRPKEVGEQIISLNLSYEIIWSVFIASICAHTALIFAANAFLFPYDENVLLFNAPWLFAFFMASVTLAGCITVTWVGQWFAGKANFKIMLALMSWLQVIQIFLQVLSYLIAILLSSLVGLSHLFILIWSFWIFVCFVDAAHQFDNILKSSFVAFIGSFLAVVLVVLLISVLGTW